MIEGIKPNWDIFLWFILISYILKSVVQIIFGVTNHKKDTHYDGGDIIGGIIGLAIVLIFLIFF